MTNKEKFIQVMNETFDAGFTLENFDKESCSPCGAFKKFDDACVKYNCEGCKKWWEKEYIPESH